MHAVWLGVIVTITHTLGVYILGALAWFFEDRFPPEVVLPWLGVASGLLVLGVGLALIRGRARAWKASRPAALVHEDHHHHDHDHHHDGDEEAHAAAHAQEIVDGAASWRGLVALGISGGLAPCPSALVLLLTAVSLGRTALGLTLVAAFSFGLALLVTAVGAAVVLFGDRLRKLPTGGLFSGVLPVVSAVIVTLLGLGLTVEGLRDLLGGGA